MHFCEIVLRSGQCWDDSLFSGYFSLETRFERSDLLGVLDL